MFYFFDEGSCTSLTLLHAFWDTFWSFYSCYLDHFFFGICLPCKMYVVTLPSMLLDWNGRWVFPLLLWFFSFEMLPFSSFIITLALFKLNDCRGFNASILDLLKGFLLCQWWCTYLLWFFCAFIHNFDAMCYWPQLLQFPLQQLVLLLFLFLFSSKDPILFSLFFMIFRDNMFSLFHAGHFGLDVCLPFKIYMVAFLSMLPVFVGGGIFLCRNTLGFLLKDSGCSFQRWYQLCGSLYLLKTDLVAASLHILRRHLCFFCSLLSCSFAIDFGFF